MSTIDSTSAFAYRVLIAVGLTALVVLLIYFLGLLLHVFMLVFAAILAAVIVDGLTRMIQRHTPISRNWSLTTAFVLILLLCGAIVGLIWPQATDQIPQLAQQLPSAIQQLRAQFPWAEQFGQQAADQASGNGAGMGQEMLSRALGIFSTALGAISSLFIILLLATYLVANPSVYISHLLQLLPHRRRARVEQMFRIQGKALQLWLLGRLVSMLFVGVITAIGLLLLDVPMAMTLGLIAGVATFIPYLGPIIGAIPAVLVAFLEGPQTALYVVMLYFLVESVESSLIYPLAQRHVVHIPPAYTVIIQIGGGVIGGIPAVILATPLAVVSAVAIQMLYIEDVLGESVEVLGDQ